VLTTVPGQKSSGTGWHWDGTALVVDADNTSLVGLDISGAVQNSHNSLTVKNTRIRCENESSWCITLGEGATVIDTEIGGGANGTTTVGAIGLLSGYYAHSITPNVIARVNIHHTIHGMRVDGDTTVTDSYIHDLPMGDAPYADAHTDGIMCTAGQNVTINHNRIETGNTATFFVQWETGNVSIGNYLIQNNLFVAITKNGQQSSYGIDIENKGIGGPITVRNNTFTYGWQVGAILNPPNSITSGNYYTDGKPASVEISP
jgi:hypothetical protein